MSTAILSAGALLDVPLQNGLRGCAQVLAVRGPSVVIAAIDREADEPPPPDEDLRVLEGGLIDAPIIEFFPAEGCPFLVVGNRDPLAKLDLDPLDVHKWDDLAGIIYWRGCHGMGDVAERMRRDYEAKQGWEAKTPGEQTQGLFDELNALGAVVGTVVTAVFWQHTPKFAVGSLLELARAFKHRDRREDPWQALPKGALACFSTIPGPMGIRVRFDPGDVALSGPESPGSSAQVGVLFSEEELRQAWASDAEFPELFTAHDRMLRVGSETYELHARACSTRRIDVTLSAGAGDHRDDDEEAALVGVVGEAPDFAALKEGILGRATAAERALLCDYESDPIATWAKVRAMDLRDPAQASATQLLAEELARRFAYNLELLVARLKDAHVEFSGDPVVFSHGAAVHLGRVEEALGLRLPPMLRALIQHIDSIDLRGWHSIDLQTEDADPLVVRPLVEGATTFQGGRDWAEALHVARHIAARGELCWFNFAPDQYHKAEYSGGEDYWILLSDYRADPLCITNHLSGSQNTLVDYLRFVIDKGGYPGLARRPVSSAGIRADLLQF